MWLLLMLGWKNCIIDRIEGEYAVIEWADQTHSDVNLRDLPKGCREGSKLLYVLRRERLESKKERYDFKPAGALECVGRENE